MKKKDKEKKDDLAYPGYSYVLCSGYLWTEESLRHEISRRTTVLEPTWYGVDHSGGMTLLQRRKMGNVPVRIVVKWGEGEPS